MFRLEVFSKASCAATRSAKCGFANVTGGKIFAVCLRTIIPYKGTPLARHFVVDANCNKKESRKVMRNLPSFFYKTEMNFQEELNCSSSSSLVSDHCLGKSWISCFFLRWNLTPVVLPLGVGICAPQTLHPAMPGLILEQKCQTNDLGLRGKAGKRWWICTATRGESRNFHEKMQFTIQRSKKKVLPHAYKLGFFL